MSATTSAAAMNRNLLVLGATGFVGESLCRKALARGWNVIGLARYPPAPYYWNRGLVRVRWIQGNALDSSIYQSIFREHHIDCVVHSIGVLMEGREINSFYESINRDTALIAAKEASKCPSIRDFVFISASKVIGAELFLSSYYKSKQEAERGLLMGNFPFRTIIARPSFMYGPGRQISYPISYAYNLFTWPFGNSLFPRALHVDMVTEAILEVINNFSRDSRILEVTDLQSK